MEIRILVVSIAAAMALLGCTSTRPWHTEQVEEGVFCANMRRLYPDLQWNELRPDTRLEKFDAVLTCRFGRVVLRSSRPIGHGLEWSQGADHFEATIAGESLLALLPLGETESRDIEVEAVAVSGVAYYSTDRHAIRRHGIFAITGTTLAGHAAMESARARDLDALKWEPLSEGRLLKPWDMVWTREGGRVEIEVMDPPGAIIRGWSAAVDEWGRRTGKNRLMGNVHFIMVPPYFRSARASRVIGDVGIATDAEAVKRYFERHRYAVSRFDGFDDEAARKWQEILRKPRLE